LLVGFGDSSRTVISQLAGAKVAGVTEQEALPHRPRLAETLVSNPPAVDFRPA